MLAFGLILASLLEIAMAQATDACDSCESAEDDGEFAFNLFSDVAPYVLDFYPSGPVCSFHSPLPCMDTHGLDLGPGSEHCMVTDMYSLEFLHSSESSSHGSL